MSMLEDQRTSSLEVGRLMREQRESVAKYVHAVGREATDYTISSLTALRAAKRNLPETMTGD